MTRMVKIVRSVALIVLPITSPQIFAQSESVSKRDLSELASSADTSGENSESQKNRSGKVFEAKLGVKPVYTSFKKSSAEKTSQMNEYLLTANFGYFLNEGTTVGAYIGRSDSTDVLLEQRVSLGDRFGTTRVAAFKWKGVSNTVGFEATHYLGNSIKATASINSSSISLDPLSNEYGIVTNPFQMKLSTFGLSFGNQWLWSNFTLNWDWLSAEYIITGKVENRELDKGSTTRGFLLVSNFSVGWAW